MSTEIRKRLKKHPLDKLIAVIELVFRIARPTDIYGRLQGLAYFKMRDLLIMTDEYRFVKDLMDGMSDGSNEKPSAVFENSNYAYTSLSMWTIDLLRDLYMLTKNVKVISQKMDLNLEVDNDGGLPPCRANIAILLTYPMFSSFFKSHIFHTTMTELELEECVNILSQDVSSEVLLEYISLQMLKRIAGKGEYGGRCNLTACKTPDEPATYYNRGSTHFYCRGCAQMLNSDEVNAMSALIEHDGPLCVQSKNAETIMNFVRLIKQ